MKIQNFLNSTCQFEGRTNRFRAAQNSEAPERFQDLEEYFEPTSGVKKFYESGCIEEAMKFMKKSGEVQDIFEKRLKNNEKIKTRTKKFESGSVVQKSSTVNLKDGTSWDCTRTTGSVAGPNQNDYSTEIKIHDENGYEIGKYKEFVHGGYSKTDITFPDSDFGKFTLSRQGKYENYSFSVSNREEHYSFLGEIDEDGEKRITFIQSRNEF